jgi:hypothetical protein
MKFLKYSFAATTLALFSWTAQAQSTVYDSLTDARLLNTVGLSANNLQEFGDLISFAGTDRLLNTVELGVTQFNYVGFQPYDVTMTLNLYETSNTTTPFATSQVIFNIDQAGLYEPIPFDFSGTNVVLPDTIFYGISYDTSKNSALPPGPYDALNIAQWCYCLPPGGDGRAIPIGVDVGNAGSIAAGTFQSFVYGRKNGTWAALGANDGLNGVTPAIRFYADSTTVAPIPEPETYALMLAGLIAVGVAARRKNKR